MIRGLLIAGLLLQERAPERVDFARDVAPIFRASCLSCHGADKPKKGFRVDAREPLLKAVVPGRSAESPLVRRLLEADPQERMPQKAPPLDPAKIGLIRRWIDQGAEWVDARHWAYVKPERPPLPAVRASSWVRNPIDAFVLARLEREGLSPSPQAAKETLLRRASLDLTGLPPSPEEADAFLADPDPEAYERRVDRLLESPHYGERWARAWMDLARYADTNGFNFDTPRGMWRWRDWVIGALNRDMPFTQFTVEQIAGDLLPAAGLDRRIASGFHRNTMLNEEDGVDRAEARWETFLDRVETTAAVWLGTTLACARCHDHKYDPFTQKDYYRFLAFFDHCKEETLDLLTPAQEARRAELRPEAARLKGVIRARGEESLEGRDAGARLARLQRELREIEVNTALSFRENPSPPVPSTRVRLGGSYDRPGEIVSCGVPASLHPWPEGAPKSRLGLALWLASEENPLAARVAVSRAWGAFFGRPLVESAEDFGTQGAPPEHPEILDWLAVEFMRGGWRMKALHRTIVTSAAYRQSSRASPEILEKDPHNRLLSRGPRFRLEAETIRDAMLAAAGLLSRKVGGPSVYPLQADTSGVEKINRVDTSWAPSPGEDRYRRGLYTWGRRTAPFAAFAAFDAPSGECCAVRRPRTNTPLQALVALNDPAHFDAARGLARRVMAEAPATRERAARAFRLATSRRPDPEDLARTEAAFERERVAFEADPARARAVFRGAELQPPEESLAEHAAWTLVANVLLNLDETLTKE